MAQRKGGLGRGLDALIQAQAGQAGGSGGVQEVEIDAIEPPITTCAPESPITYSSSAGGCDTARGTATPPARQIPR